MGFKDQLQKQRQVLADSNQSNLANAYLYVEESILKCQNRIKALEAMKLELEQAGDLSEVLADTSGSITHALWDKARKI